MTHSPIYLSRDDHARLRLLIDAALRSPSGAALHKLRSELDRAIVDEPSALPDGVVCLDSSVEFEDLATGEVEEYAITLPDRADVERRRLSVLAPIGTALIGCRVGDIVHWTTPGGVRQLRVRRASSGAGALRPMDASR